MRTTTENDDIQGCVPPIFPTLRLLYLGGTGVLGRTFVPRHGVTLLGRAVSEAEGVPLQSDRKASSRHARIELTEIPTGTAGPRCALRLIDERSRNGTFVNGQPVTLANLYDGDVIRIGSSLLLLRFEPARSLDARVDAILGCSPAIRTVRYQLQRVAQSTIPVLLLGEPGVGKELAAQALHKASGRRGELIAVNCAAIPEHLAESLLFGHERGAFSGAETRQDGFFQAAEGGTLFLDEVGESSPSVQGKLLRALQEKQITPVGRTRTIPCDVRVVTATNRDLALAVRSGKFRDDLYSRLRGEVITLPPLVARREDILPILVHAIAQRGAEQSRLAPRAAEALVLYHWPHNFREIWQMAEVVGAQLATGAELDLPMIVDRLQPLMESGSPEPSGRSSGLRERKSEAPEPRSPRLSAEVLTRLGKEHHWNISKLALAVGRSRRQVRRWLQEYGLHPVDSQDAHGPGNG